jgi:hypothetical protein
MPADEASSQDNGAATVRRARASVRAHLPRNARTLALAANLGAEP